MVKACISGRPVDARVVYSLNGGPDLTEPLVFQDGEYRAEIPPTLCAGELKFRLRLADAFLRTHWTDYATATVVAADSDGDGLSDALERIYTLDAGKKDSDGDGLMDANDPAPLSAFALPADWQGPAITAVITTPRMPPAAGREGTLLATVFDPTGVQKVTALVSVGGRSVVSADMRQIGTSQVYQVRIPAFDAEKTVTATVSATNSGGRRASGICRCRCGWGSTSPGQWRTTARGKIRR